MIDDRLPAPVVPATSDSAPPTSVKLVSGPVAMDSVPPPYSLLRS